MWRNTLKHTSCKATHAFNRLFSNLNYASIKQAADALKSNHTSAVDLTKNCIDQINRTSDLNLFISTNFSEALELAAESDKRRRNNRSLGILDGIPMAFKDSFCMKNKLTTAASKMLSDFVSPYESTATQRLLDYGVIPLGKLNMDEFAMGSATIFSNFGPSINPWSSDSKENSLVCGGSSGGTAGAVAAGCCFAALGSDTGGSIRQPAAYCGVVGFKPTYGQVSRHGLIAFASSLDTVGIVTRNVRDSGIVLNAVAGHDGKDSTSTGNKMSRDWCLDFDKKSKAFSEITVGIPKEYFVQELPDDIIDAWNLGIQLLKDIGVKVVEVSLPSTKHALPAYYIISGAEASSNLARYDGIRFGYRNEKFEQESQYNYLQRLFNFSRSDGFGEEVQRRILSGAFVLSAGFYRDYYQHALMIRRKVTRDFEQAFLNGVDFLITPTTPTGPFKLNSPFDPVMMYLNDIMTIPPSLAGLPSISVPISYDKKDHLPLGLQLIASRHKEEKLLNIAHHLESNADFILRKII